MRRWSALSALSAIVVVIGGCTVGDSAEGDASRKLAPTRQSQEILVTGKPPRQPGGCAPREVARQMQRLVAAFGTGDRRELGTVLAPDSSFVVFSVASRPRGTKGFFVTSDPRDVLTHFEMRPERTRLLMVKAIDSRMGVGLDFLLSREGEALDGGRRWLANGKGEMLCPSRRIAVWNMGLARPMENGKPLGVALPCARPRGWDPQRGPAIVCGR